METLLQSTSFHAAAFAALGRINDFLASPDQRDSPLITSSNGSLDDNEGIALQTLLRSSSDGMRIRNGQFGWDTDKPVLSNVDLDIRRGSFCLIIGP